MAWNCLLGSPADFSNEMNYDYCWHIDPISGAFFPISRITYVPLSLSPLNLSLNMPCSLGCIKTGGHRQGKMWLFFFKSMNPHLYVFSTYVSMATLRSVEFRKEIPMLMKSVYSLLLHGLA